LTPMIPAIIWMMRLIVVAATGVPLALGNARCRQHWDGGALPRHACIVPVPVGVRSGCVYMPCTRYTRLSRAPGYAEQSR
jgi:hypothetical protein